MVTCPGVRLSWNSQFCNSEVPNTVSSMRMFWTHWQRALSAQVCCGAPFSIDVTSMVQLIRLFLLLCAGGGASAEASPPAVTEQTALPYGDNPIKIKSYVSFYQNFKLTLSQHQKLKVATEIVTKWKTVSVPLNKMGRRMLLSHQESAPSALWCHTRLSSSLAWSWADSNKRP